MPFHVAFLLAAGEYREPLIPLWLMELLASGFLYAWLFCLGATVGSFLNVVVYRLPRGKNLAYPGSYCPRCGHPIRLQDNIPILSWLVLRGRCRDCGRRISPRYFLVELTVATLFLIVLASEFFLPAGLGFQLYYVPRRLLTPHDGVPFWCMYVIHVCLITTFLGAVFIQSDRNPVPARLFFPVTVLGFALPLVWPEIRGLPAMDKPLGDWRDGLIDGLAGLAAGVGIGMWIRLFRGRWSGSWSTSALVALGCCVGVVLGWQPTPLWTAISWILMVVAASMLSAIRRHDEPPTTHESTSDSQPAPAAQLDVQMPAEEILPVPPTQEIDPP